MKKTAKNSTTFSNYIRNVPVEDDEIIVSLDVSSLYTNIPIIYTLNKIKNYVNNDDQFTRKTAILQDKFLDLVHLILTSTRYTLIYLLSANHGTPNECSYQVDQISELSSFPSLKLLVKEIG